MGLNVFSLKKIYRDRGDVEGGQKEDPINSTKNVPSNRLCARQLGLGSNYEQDPVSEHRELSRSWAR